MTREEILREILESLGESKWILAVLYRDREKEPIGKEKLKTLANEYYTETTGELENLITSRYILDVFTARLEGAGLVRISRYGQVRMYSISKLGEEIIQFSRQLQ